jgi:hypothetical protein
MVSKLVQAMKLKRSVGAEVMRDHREARLIAESMKEVMDEAVQWVCNSGDVTLMFARWLKAKHVVRQMMDDSPNVSLRMMIRKQRADKKAKKAKQAMKA